jgi:UDP-N-acetylglucosamine 2-epimerase (non-hydrolysing)
VQIIAVAGARPNFMKIAPVMTALDERGVDVTLVHTGQHYDERMSDVFFDELGLRAPDRHLGVGSGSHAEQTARVMIAFETVIADVRPDVVLVVGDVNSTLGCALVAAKAGPLVAHVEAGLRSRDWSMPEEINRVATDRLSDYLLAPSPDAIDNLRSEGYRDDQIHLVGNVMVDTLLANLGRALARPTPLEFDVEPGRYGLVTLHRPSNVDDDVVLCSLIRALADIAVDLPLLYPVHPRLRRRAESIGIGPGIRLIPPVGYLDFIALEARARLVLTDSGGVQEETTMLGVPCLTLRDNTERPITVSEGTNRVVGTDPHNVVAAARDVLQHGVEPRRPSLWDGRAAERIATVLLADELGSRMRPTDRAPTYGLG